MKLEKAIKLIQADIDDEDVEWNSPLGRAYKLSFEALKRIIEFHEDDELLPGETKE